jgi:hypothetical protein
MAMANSLYSYEGFDELQLLKWNILSILLWTTRILAS